MKKFTVHALDYDGYDLIHKEDLSIEEAREWAEFWIKDNDNDHIPSDFYKVEIRDENGECEEDLFFK